MPELLTRFSSVPIMAVDKNQFYELMKPIFDAKTSVNTSYFTKEMYDSYLRDVRVAKIAVSKSSLQYRRLRRFDILSVDCEEKLISPKVQGSDDVIYFACYGEFFDIIEEAHLSTGHGGRNRLICAINRKYKNVTVEAINVYLKLCSTCEKKRHKPKKGITTMPIVPSEMNYRCQVDFIDMPSNPDDNFRFIMVYQDETTKFVVLRPIKCKSAEDVAYQLMDIFSLFGAPYILHCDNGREFANSILTKLSSLWPEVKLVHGKPRRNKSQDPVECANQDIKNMLGTWMKTNKTKKWFEGLRFVQAMKNSALHSVIKRSPYEAMFGVTMKMGLASSTIPANVLPALHTEEDLEGVLKGIGNEEKVTERGEEVDHAIDVKKCEAEQKTVDTKNMCQRTTAKVRHREESHETLVQKAKKMKSIKSSQLNRVNIEQTVRIKVPDLIPL